MRVNRREKGLLVNYIRTYRFLFAAIIFLSFFVTMITGFTTYAAQTVPYKINFRGSLNTSANSPVADGLYNMTFRLYDASTGGTLQWSEVRATTNRVQVSAGVFSVQLGDVVSLPPAVFTNQNLYFEVEMASPATATCSTAGCASYTEGPMTPRSKLASAAYAMNADAVDGIDGSNIGTLNGTNTFTGANDFTGGISASNGTVAWFGMYTDGFYQTARYTDMNVDNFKIRTLDSASTLFLADTTQSIVKVGTTSASTLANVRLLSTSAEFSGTVRIGTLTNGIDISGTSGIALSGTARPTQTVSLMPEYPGATFVGDGTNNLGSLSSDFCSGSARLNINAAICGATTNEFNYYQWNNAQATVQDYDLYVRYKVPADYDTGSMTNLTLQRWGTVVTTDKVHISMYGSAAATLCSSNTANIATNATWQTITIAAPLGSCTVVAGNILTFKIHVEAAQNNVVRAGEITFQYRSKF